MHTVLDLDLDYFVWPIALDRAEDAPRLDPNEYTPKSEQDVRQFLEEKCGLSINHRLPGRRVVHHVNAFTTWREWLEESSLAAPFHVVHVDAHADLGSGFMNESPLFFETELLALPLEQRISTRMGSDAVNSGNYLTAAVANRWIAKLTYVYPTDPTPIDSAKREEHAAIEKLRQFLSNGSEGESYPRDLPPYCFKDGDPTTRTIRLEAYSEQDYRLGEWSKPIAVEPEVPFDWVKAEQFEFSEFTHIVVAQSPSYTPHTADPLLEVIGEYFTPA